MVGQPDYYGIGAVAGRVKRQYPTAFFQNSFRFLMELSDAKYRDVICYLSLSEEPDPFDSGITGFQIGLCFIEVMVVSRGRVYERSTIKAKAAYSRLVARNRSRKSCLS